jgi:hypothetical protein
MSVEFAATISRAVSPLADPMPECVSPKLLPSWVSFFGAPDELVLIVSSATSESLDNLLVFGLHHGQGRRLHLVFPRDTEETPVAAESTRIRAAFLRTPVHVWTYLTSDPTTSSLRASEPYSRTEALNVSHREEARGKQPGLVDTAPWISALRAWASLAGLLHDSGRGKWYLNGASMMELTTNGRGSRLIVGARSGEHPRDEYAVAPNGEPTPEQWTMIAGRIGDDAKSEWFEKRLRDYPEHDIQDAIGRNLIDLGWSAEVLLREYPATRPNGGLGLVDFLGLDSTGTLRIVETKVGDGDRMMPLQGLDYWIWAAANKRLVENAIGRPFTSIRLDFVIGRSPKKRPNGRILNTYAPAVLSELDADIAWEIHTIPELVPAVRRVVSWGAQVLEAKSKDDK